MLRDLVLKARSYRRFDQSFPIEDEALRALVDLARLSPSAANLQPLKYLLSNEPERNAAIFATLSWAGYLKDWPGPEEGERPSAYIIVLGDTSIAREFSIDEGIAAQSIMLGAVEQGLGGCLLSSIKRDVLRQALDVPENFEILLVVALGKPKEIIALEPVGAEGDVRYWHDAERVHHVPKRSLDDVIL